MAIEVGMILEGKVSGITKFGAFVDLPDSKPVWYISRRLHLPSSMKSVIM